MTEDAVCTEPDAGPQLVWSLSLDLGVLAEETISLDMASTGEASLIFEFHNGRRAVWPPPEQGEVDLGSDANAQTHVSAPENVRPLLTSLDSSMPVSGRCGVKCLVQYLVAHLQAKPTKRSERSGYCPK